ncbi:MAG: outer membrane beta-barrel protein [Bacteroidia bacterium]
MKKIILLFVVLFPVCMSAQFIERGDKIISVHGSFGLYKYQFTDKNTNMADPRDTSAAFNFPVSFEYGLFSWLSGAAHFNYINYIEGDSSQNEQARGIDAQLGVNFHIPWKFQRFDFCAGLAYGFSNFKYTVTDNGNEGIAKANGSAFSFTINPRFYFSSEKHLGMSFLYRNTSYLYNNGNITYSNSSFNVPFKMDGPGSTFGLGLFYRI